MSVEHPDQSRERMPAWGRFEQQVFPSTRIVVIVAPVGSGREEIARAWADQTSGGLVIDAVSSPHPLPATIDDMVSRLDADPACRIALLAPNDPGLYQLLHREDTQIIGGRTFQLTRDDIGALLGTDDPERIEDVFLRTGGWLHAVRAIADGEDGPALASAARSAVIGWISRLENRDRLAEVAFLTVTDEDALIALAEALDAPPVTGQDLEAAGLTVRANDGTVLIPEVTRTALQDYVRTTAPERARLAEEAAVRVLGRSEQVEQAVEQGIAQNAWGAVQEIVSERWADLMLDNPERSHRLLSRVPARILTQLGFTQGLLEAIGALRGGRLQASLPALPIAYEDDETVQALRRAAEQRAQRPGTLSVTLAIALSGISRIHGHFVEAAASAAEARRILANATAVAGVNHTAAALAELQAGISLQLGDQPEAAAEAYRSVIVWASMPRHAFVRANANANLALLAAVDGETVAARTRLRDFAADIGQVRWGADMIGRGAMIARGLVAVHELDVDGVDAALEDLPSAPDDDELWPAHAHLIALRHALFGSPATGVGLLSGLRSSRAISAASPYACYLLDLSEAALAASVGRPDGWTAPANRPMGNLVRALSLYMAGDLEGTLAQVRSMSGQGLLRGRAGGIARSLELLARHPASSLPAADLHALRLAYDSEGELIDLLPLWASHHRKSVATALDLDADECARLDRAHWAKAQVVTPERPRLTPEETDILADLRAGRSRSQIAAVRGVSENVVRSRTRSLYRKLRAATLQEALDAATHWGL